MLKDSMKHKFLQFSMEGPDVLLSRDLAAYIINKYIQAEYSKSKLDKMRTFQFKWEDEKKGTIISHISLSSVTIQLRKNRKFEHEQFNLWPLKANYLDSSVDMGLPQPILGSDKKAVKFNLPVFPETAFPISPLLDREGVAANNLTNVIHKNIIHLTKQLIFESDTACTTIASSWFSCFRMLLNEIVSSIDITLHMIWFLAQYNGEKLGWRFDAKDLGTRHGGRLNDKFTWIGKVTGRPLDHAEKEIQQFTILKDIRNQLNHFVPPCFAYTMEEVAEWLNLVKTVGILHWKIRQRLGFQLSSSIVEMILLPQIVFVPMPGRAERPPNEEPVGYASSQWL